LKDSKTFKENKGKSDKTGKISLIELIIKTFVNKLLNR